MADKKKLVIIGTGFMGGCIAKSVRRRRLPFYVWGLARNRKKAAGIAKTGIFDRTTSDLDKAIKSADLIILATPVSAIVEYIKLLSKKLEKNTLVTDVGSTKSEIVKNGRKYLADRFVGSHPVCGSEKKGIRFSVDDLFEGAVCIVTYGNGTRQMKKIKRFWSGLGARVHALRPDRHDRILAFTSALPHVLSFSLTGTVPAEFAKSFAGGSFRDMARVSASEAGIWADIFFSNKKYVLKAANKNIKVLKEILRLLKAKDKKKLDLYLKKINGKFQRLT